MEKFMEIMSRKCKTSFIWPSTSGNGPLNQDVLPFEILLLSIGRRLRMSINVHRHSFLTNICIQKILFKDVLTFSSATPTISAILKRDDEMV